MLSRKNRKKTLKTTPAKLEITFFVSSLGTVCRARQWPRRNFLWESQFDIIMFSWWKHPSKTANKLFQTTDTPESTCLSHVHAVLTSTRVIFFCCSSCVMLHFSLLILWQDLMFFWWLNKKIWSSHGNRALTKTESHSQPCGGKADPSHWVW